MVEGKILFRIGDRACSGKDVPRLVREATVEGPAAAATLYLQLTEVSDIVVRPHTRRQRSITADLVRAEGQLLYERGVLLNHPSSRDELQALYNGLSELQEYLNGSATLRAVHDAPVPAERDLFLYADYGHRYRYHVSVLRHRTVDLAGARIGSVGETRQDLAVTDLRLDELLARDEGSARYVLTVPPHIARQQDLVRLFLTKFVGVKRRAWRLGHYPVVL